MTLPFALMLFMICPAGWTIETQCEQGILYSQTCAAGRTWMARGLRPRQVLVVHSCREANERPLQ